MLAARPPAPPAIDAGGILNAASHLPASLAGGAIARGARFTISGIRLGPDPGVEGSQSDPPASLGGVSVRIAQGETYIQAGLFLVSGERIEGWLPFSTALGRVSVTVTYEGRVSEPYALTVVTSSFGFFSTETRPDATPGGRLELTGTGSGGAPLEIFVGGRPVRGAVRASADACCKGIERVAFRVPPDAPLGCSVPVQAVAPGGRPGNTIGIAVHPAGEVCRDRVDWFRDSAAQASRAGFVLLGHVAFAPDHDFDYGYASFGREEAGHRALPPLPPSGSCSVIAGSLNVRQVVTRARNLGPPAAVTKPEIQSSRLDAGAAISIKNEGERLLERESRAQSYDGLLGGFPPFSRKPPAPLFLRPGVYGLASAGGADIGAFSAEIEIPGPIVWTNREQIDHVDRRTGTTVKWRPARRNAAILIAAVSADDFSGDTAACVCVANARDGRFTIPARAVGNLPFTSEENKQLSYLLVAEIPPEPVRLRARGLDAAYAAYLSISVRAVEYK